MGRMRLIWPLAMVTVVAVGQVLEPPDINLAINRKISATATCGEVNGQPIKELYCSLAGATQYSPLNQYSYRTNDDSETSPFAELRIEKQSFVQGGQNCDYCEAGTANAHPATNMVDGGSSWWQSPPLSRGMQYNNVNITIDLGQQFHVAYVWIQMANSPRPGAWMLERSVDDGKTWMPWQYFAETPSQCEQYFGAESLLPITSDDSVICTTDYSRIVPLEDGEIYVTLLQDRPSRHNFTYSRELQNFARATNIRFRLMSTKTLQGHLMDVSRRQDPTITRRYFYAIKEIYMGGRCVCNGHAKTCDVLDSERPRMLLCRCEHNTCGDMCEQCCPGYEQKKWQRAREGQAFRCERCNCHFHSEECQYDEELDRLGLSLDINGKYEGGGHCLNCRDNTEGVNCNKCKFGFYRPRSKHWNETDVCQPCVCDPYFHSGACAEETGQCECKERFLAPDCRECAKGYHDPPECRPCDCNVVGVLDETCSPLDGQCPCKENYGGMFCEQCATGYTNVTAGCIACQCEASGSLNQNCSQDTAQCICKTNFGGLTCDQCADGYFGHPKCDYCDCDPSGTEADICDKTSGQCLCKPGYAGDRCDKCNATYYGYPNCQPCACDLSGSKVAECDQKTGECPCFANFTGRTCDKCAAGFYDFPKCAPCSCFAAGSKGSTCNTKGECYCKDNFEGQHCDVCKPNFYNFPICEECNCHPNGVAIGFGGCDTVQPGELCTCRKHVTGRICDKCLPTYWDLQFQHTEGCIDCDCHLPGTLSMLNECHLTTGQCLCKRYAGGRRCDKCAEGFYNMLSHSRLGCEPCNCDIGGAMTQTCDQVSGQCRCRPRITGQACTEPIDNHFFPTLWHVMYEAEDGRTPEQQPVRFAIDDTIFPNFSWRGYAVFSPIQDTIVLEVDITKSSVYRLLFKYINPTAIDIDAEVTLAPYYTQSSEDVDQKAKVSIPASQTPSTVSFDKTPFVMNPGKWLMTIKTKQRLLLDFIVLLPSEYYEGTLLKATVSKPCEALYYDNTTCVDLLYPKPPFAARADATGDKANAEIFLLDENDDRKTMDKVPIEILPSLVGQAVWVRADDSGRRMATDLIVPEEDEYVIMVEYYSLHESDSPLNVTVTQDGETVGRGRAIVHHCPYATFCRELLSNGGKVETVKLIPGEATVTLSTDPMVEFGLGAITLIRAADWSPEYLAEVPHCVRRDGVCVNQVFPSAPNSIVTEAETGNNANNSIPAAKLPFPVANADSVSVLALDNTQATIDVKGVVPTRGHYIFIIHYFNPDNRATDLDVLLQNDHFYQGLATMAYCPSVSGCRTIIRQKDRPEVYQFWMEDKYVVSLYHNTSQQGPIYIDSIIAVPFHSYTESLMKAQAIDVSGDYIKECSDDHYNLDPATASDFCKSRTFSLTAQFNLGAFSCDCNSQGSTSFGCAKFGGQCSCRPNIIGRRCERCKPGFYDFPHCQPCKCGPNQQCNEKTGQCYCPLHVEGKQCDKCVSYAFGYDPLIGCQLCGCHPQGSEGGQLQCDPMNGQCLCKQNVGGRKCDVCLPGFYGFPHCYECACDSRGTTPEVCDQTTARCICKKNVVGNSCEACKAGTFDLRASNPEGCSNCFCFGTTDQCRSSFIPAEIVEIKDNWTVTDTNGTVTVAGESIEYKASDSPPKEVYFLAPAEVIGERISSYGLNLSFTVSAQPSADGARISVGADVVLVGTNYTLEYWSTEQPVNPKKPFDVIVPLLAEKFSQADGSAVTRPQIMLALNDLRQLRIKASYYERPASAILTNVQLQSVGNDPNLITGELVASSVEVCDCPAPYTGSSCQECALGYYRVKSGPYLGACVPCQCNSHSGTCDKVTGECFDCQHDTYGPHCEFCNAGFYGNATTGSPYSCLPCACPHPTRGNNFAESCQVSETGSMLSCECKTGYTGERCDRCDAGWFGEPLRLGGFCSPCSCNDNNDLTIPGACHPITGHCDKCQAHTTGTKCEVCTAWYHGDAVAAKNCTECKCDQCGSSYCDHQTGGCSCHPLVEGPNCDHCVANTWGFSSCRGCEQCNCAQASVSPQCNMETGQCACMRGATGVQCEQCEHGFWDYGPQGCRKCDCEADLSMGTVCDVHTGHCQCQEGATGPRCDTCIKDYLRIPTFGCRYCDECVHSLNADLDTFGHSVMEAKDILSNVSTAALTGARLKRITVAVDGLKPEAEKLLSLSSEIGMDNLKGDVAMLKASVSDIIIKGNRSLAEIEATLTKANGILDETEQTARDAVDRVDTAQGIVEILRTLVKSIGQNSGATGNRVTLVKDAEQLLESIRSTNFDDADNAVKAAMEDAQAVLGKTATFQERRETLLNRTKRIADESLSIANRSQDYRNFITKVMQQVAEAKTSIKQMSPFALLALVAGLDSNEVAAQAHLNEANELLGDAQALLNSIAGVNEQLTNQLADFNSTSTRMTDELPSYQSQFAELKQIPMQCNARVAELQHEASRLSGIFGGTRLEAENAMTAANAYSEIGETIAAARETSAALVEADLPSEEEGAGESKATTEESASLHRRAAEARKVVVNNLTSSLDGAHKAIKAVLDTVVSGKKRVETVKVDMAALGESGLLSARLEKASETSAEASDKLDTVHQFVESLLPSLENIANLTSATVTVAARRSQDLKGARTQTNQTKSVVPSAIEALERLQLAAANASAAMDDVIHQISLLRKKIALARDMANRIKVGARFEKGSSLQLYNPERVTRSAAYTKIRFFFRTNSTDGLLLYFGNEVGASGTRAVPTDDYIAIELVQGQPKLVVDLGGAPLTITADTFAADGKWRRITVERTGKATSLSVDAENEQTVKSQGVVPGSKSVLNLHQEFSKLYVGGVPGHARMPNTLRSRNFVGDIEQLTFHDDPVGLWNVVEGGTINVQGADQRNDMRTTTSANGISLNGEGFAVMNLGSWNPRKQTEFMISFRTYAREGLIMYIGKERDFMSLELNDGRPVLQFDCGSGRAKLTSEKGPYNDGKWHMVHVHRVERHAKLTVDEDDTVEADAPGTLFELSVTDVFYIGGVPSGVDTKTRIRPFHGCIEKVQLEGYYVNLNEARSSKGVEPGCVDTSVRVITFDVGGGWSQFTDQPITGDIELTLRFKTEKTSGLLAYLADAEKKSVFSVYLDDGFIVVESNGEGKDKDKLKTELSSASDGDWHFVTASRTAQQLRVEIDDLYSREVDRNVMDETVADLKAALRFGNRADEEEDFVGCIGDVTLNGRFLDFANAESSPTVQLTGCALAEFVPTVDPTSATTRPRSPTDLPVVTPTTFVPAPTRNPGECALRRQPYGAREDSVGFRFGLHTGSRLEYDRLPEAFDKSGVFSLQFRATASSGVLFFATNEKHTDHLALYLKDGKVVFSYNSGSGTAILESKRPYIDGEWHTVRVEREGTAGKMTVDDAEEVHGESPKGTDAVDTQPPFYVGGLPTDLVPFATRVIPGSRPEFGGCMRDFKLNDVKFQPPSNEVGVVPCSQFEEDGLFFRGTNNSHAVLDSELVIGSSFSLEMELKPRVKTGVIVSISANDLDYLSLQLIDGSVKFALDNGGGAQTLVHKPTAVNALCDGHWHNIKIYKTKNLMTMTVDGKSGMKVIKKADSTETNTKDPLYLGGVPEGYLTRGLETREPYAGCVRVVSLGTKPRIKKNISLANVTIVGDVAHSCPIN